MSNSNDGFMRIEQDAETQAFQRFIGAMRGFWAGPLYRGIAGDARELDAANRTSNDREDYAWLDALPEHQIFGWLEHNIQRMKYEGRWGLANALEPQREALEKEMAAPLPEGLLVENPDLEMPDYYDENDFHHHPGGLGRDDLAALLYRESAGVSGGVVGNAALHDRFARHVTGEGSYRRAVDIGCGFGRSTLAFMRTGQVGAADGLDLSASCVRLAAHLANNAGEAGNVSFIQADGASVPLPDGCADIVTSTMLLHELPPDAIKAMTGEAYRLLAPGGIVAHLDFLPPSAPFERALYYGHSDRNNEPFMRTLAAMDLEGEHRAAGFSETRIEDFAESDAPRGERWRLPWTVIWARK